MNYLSVCSGIEAATVAWHPLGWTPHAFAEIEKFPSAVLAHHYPTVPNLGDMTRYQEWPDADVSLLVGGTPCQSFSVAGLRKGLADPRGNLTLTFLAIAARHRPRWLVWENVPGVLSDGDGAFWQFLDGLSELGYGWAWRVLDAQYFGVAQRRRRPFVVGHLGDWRCAAAVLFERESLSGNPAPSRESRERIAPSLAARTRGGGGLGTDAELDGAVIAIPEVGKGPRNMRGSQVADAGEPMFTLQSGATHAVAHALRAEGFDASEDGSGRGIPLVSMCLNAGAMGRIDSETETMIPVAFSSKDYGADAANDCAPTLRAMGHDGSHANAGGQVAVAFDWNNSAGAPNSEETFGTLSSRRQMAVKLAMQVRRLTPRECERLQGFPDDHTLVPYRGKPAADGPRYKALGNSMAVPVMRWIGERIAAVESI